MPQLKAGAGLLLSASLHPTKLSHTFKERLSVKELAAFIITSVIFADFISTQERQSESKGLFRVSQNHKEGYIDRTGKIVIPLKFDGARNFSEGLAAVKVADNWGFIDETGNVVIEPQFSGAYEFLEGLARVQIGGDKYGNYGWISNTV